MDHTAQQQFFRDWGHLQDPHVRALAWMLTSPQLLDESRFISASQIAEIDMPSHTQLTTWFAELDQDPSEFHVSLDLERHRRLGHYAENLLAYFFRHQENLVAHGLQIHDAKKRTIGEFDFLVEQKIGLLHLEIATKFYLLFSDAALVESNNLFDFLGPNLADSLGAKMGKIVDQQLSLSAHPLAQALLPRPVSAAQALVKGWLFYPHSQSRSWRTSDVTLPGIIANHSRGFWCGLDELYSVNFEQALILPRLSWLAPAIARTEEVLTKAEVMQEISQHFTSDHSPLMLALMQEAKGQMREFARGMIVPKDWVDQARMRRQLGN